MRNSLQPIAALDDFLVAVLGAIANEDWSSDSTSLVSAGRPSKYRRPRIGDAGA
jgi:hypothetical protein